MQFSSEMKQGFQAALEKCGARYTDRKGQTYIAARPDDVISQMRDMGWRRIPRTDYIDCKESGFTVVEAYYAARARKVERYCHVVVLSTLEEYLAQKEAV